MSSSAPPSSTAGTSQPGQAGGVGSGAEGASPGNNPTKGAEGNVLEKPQNGVDGVGHAGTEPDTSTPAHHRSNGEGGVGGVGNSTGTGTVFRRKTNVCLICGIYTNLSLNIFEPRNGPNIVDVIYEKYKFRAERGDNADKHICFSCNNWLINWYSLQNTSSGNSRTYEPVPSTSRSSSAADSSNNSRPGRHHVHKPRTKTTRDHRNVTTPSSSNDKENRQQRNRTSYPEQHSHVSSTTKCSEREQPTIGHSHPYSKKVSVHPQTTTRQAALKEINGPRRTGVLKDVPQHQRQRSISAEAKENSFDEVSSSTELDFDPYTLLVKPFENRLIKMLEGQGTSVTKESAVRNGNDGIFQNGSRIKLNPRMGGRIRYDVNGNVSRTERTNPRQDVEDCGREIVLSFDSALSEVIDVVPSLRAIQYWNNDASLMGGSYDEPADPVAPLRHGLSTGSLSLSIIGEEETRINNND